MIILTITDSISSVSMYYLPRRSRDLSYCPIYKAGSTTWIYNLCLLMNVTEEELNNGKKQISTIARGIIPELEFPEAEEVMYCSLINNITLIYELHLILNHMINEI